MWWRLLTNLSNNHERLDTMHLYSLLIPVYNEEENLEHLYQRLCEVWDNDEGDYKIEFIFIDDGSTDNSLNVLKAFAKNDSRIKIISFARNFGSWTAITAGIDYAKGDIVAWMSADLQDPPELIPQLIEKWKEGYQVVWAVRSSRKDPLLKRMFSALFYKILRRSALPDFPARGTDFCLMDKKVADVFRSFREKNRFVQGLILSIGFKQAEVGFERGQRYAGKSKWNFRKLFKLSLDAIVSFSYMPLRSMTYIGLLAATLSFIYGIHVIIERIFFGTPVMGLASVIAAIMFFGGLHSTMLGIIGEYIWRIFEEVKQRPLYIVKDKMGFDVNSMEN